MKHKVLIIALTFLTILLFGGALLLNQFTIKLNIAPLKYDYTAAFPELIFEHPDGIYNPGDGTNRLFVIDQMGLIYVFENRQDSNITNIFLDIHNQIHLGAFLGLTFHPNYSQNGYFFVNYLADNPLRTIISRWSVAPDNPNKADLTSQKILLEIPRLSDSHAGGQLAFGPDGYLYIALGDGNPYSDLTDNAQNKSSLFGKILRIGVNNPSQHLNYSIPIDNPFRGNTENYREEIYAYGFRNPWRFSFDFATGKLWAGDVGQDRMEEIDIIEKGKNYGWNIMEGTLPFKGGNVTGLEPPIWSYGRDQGNATIGGFVYRGSKLPELFGYYIYGDYVSGRIWALSIQDTKNLINNELVKTQVMITSFGVDEKGELYFCAGDGKIYELVSQK